MTQLYSAAKIVYVAYYADGIDGDFYVICVKDMDNWYNNFLLRPKKAKALAKELNIKNIEESIGKLLLLDVTDSFGSGKLPVFFQTSPRKLAFHTDNHIYSLLDSTKVWEMGDNGV